jgi:hypothetical protein
MGKDEAEARRAGKIKTMKKLFWTEGLVLSGIGFVALVEGIRLVKKVDPDAISDVLGPGYYIFCLGVFLAVTGLAHLLSQYGKSVPVKKEEVHQEPGFEKINWIVFYMMGTFLVYILFINLFGYLGPTFFFFLFEFRLAGVKSWKRNIVVTSVVTAVFYLIFIQYCRIVFPPGLFFT